ncbi:MAG: amidohydrolase [Synergistaceae bacterium]|nr:amidohydrolase [Synergistaceae bacterium]
MNNFLAQANNLRDKLLEIRKQFHRIPEIGNHEFKTAGLIEKYLDESGISHKRVLDTGIIAKLDGTKPGRNSALRTDIDALPINEATNCEFASQNPGFMHACGHDVHITGVLGAAMILANNRENLSGSVTFLFQPDEEGDGGAERLIKLGALDGIDAVFGAHVDPTLKAGDIGIKYGNFYASSAMFNIRVIGKSSHGAQRNKGVDSIEAASHLIIELLNMNAPGQVVTVGKFTAGTARNILAGESDLQGIIRTFGVNERSKMCDELKNLTREIPAKFGAKSECEIISSAPGVINDNDKINLFVEKISRETLGSEHVKIIDTPTMISEDFGCYIMAKTGCFYHIGAESEYPLHSDKFLPKDDAIITASAIHSAVVTNFNMGLI